MTTEDHLHLPPADTSPEGDDRWAFGTGFTDPLHGVDTALPPGADGAALAAYCLALGDDALVLAQRLAQWCTRAPELEEEVALANIGLDLLGQARLLLTRAGQADGSGRDEDRLAYFRDAPDFRNVLLAELPNGDFAHSTARLLALSVWRLALFGRLTGSADPVLAAVAAKGVSELAYHREYAAQWVVRLGDGTDESHRRMQEAVDALWPRLGELLAVSATERRAVDGGFGADPAAVNEEFEAVMRQVLDAAGLRDPGPLLPGEPAGRLGAHSEHLAPLLDEMQSVARAHPEATW
ncbi:phenylacetate-CoA oxygenase subunit PaaC [Streptomyces thermolineatus]|uniref:Phenylacetate-CoA oxygenase subunit PaaC n=1 Tax=Streptomyces thermolineatus TaxID=44033 RepID=A0ABN3LNP7_9ACTN